MYTIRQIDPRLADQFPDQTLWHNADEGALAHFHPESTTHHPGVRFRLVWDQSALYLRFDVHDRFVRCLATTPQSMVCCDSCVEFFVQPAHAGYLNFEFAANGTPLCYHILDPRRVGDHFADYRPLTAAELAPLRVHSSLQGVIDPEISHPLDWWLAARIPLQLLSIAGAQRLEPGARWRGNFYKCADHTSHPHWAAWNPIGEQLNFHQPQCFGELLLVASPQVP